MMFAADVVGLARFEVVADVRDSADGVGQKRSVLCVGQQRDGRMFGDAVAADRGQARKQRQKAARTRGESHVNTLRLFQHAELS